MSEKNNINEFDLMMKSILDEARAEVPEHVWEGISAGLDKAARRRTVVLWWRRAAVGVAAAAAVAIGVFMNHDTGSDFVPQAGNSDMIAVVEPVVVAPEEISEDPETGSITQMTLVAEAGETVPQISGREDFAVTGAPKGKETAEETEKEKAMERTEVAKKAKTEETVVSDISDDGERIYFPDNWGEEEDIKKKRNVSVTFSGLTGTNNSQNQNKLRPMKRPQVTSAPQKTGIEETSVKSTYGIPLSFGAGVKFDISEKWSVGTGLNYTFLSRQFYGKYTKVNEEGIIDNVLSSDICNRQHYIGIPVNIFYDVVSNERINFYAYAGGMAEKCVSNTYNVLSTKISHKEKASGIQLSANAGIGVEFMLGKQMGLYIDPSLRYYFNCNQPKNIRTIQPLMLGFEMGFRVRL